jgi:predicted Rossmann fold nucleotide-binding protein DprA/Smf involved in DNA uptake
MSAARAVACRTIVLGEPDYPRRFARELGEAAPPQLSAFGNLQLLDLRLLAIFSSIRTPPDLFLRSFDLARSLRAGAVPTISGFQSPLEKECLGILLRGTQPVVVCPARAIEGMRLPRPWRAPLGRRRMLVLSPFVGRLRRPTLGAALVRNRMVAALAERIFVVHARVGNRCFRTAAAALAAGKEVYCFDHPRNRELMLLGAAPADATSLVGERG